MIRAVTALRAATTFLGRALGAVATCVLILGHAAAAQTATLLADSVELRAGGALVASGAVEVLYDGSRLTASRILYDRGGDRLTIDGPITLTQGDRVMVLADQAALSPDLRDGILRSARVVLDRQLQLAATAASRVEGRYTVLDDTVASSCEVCAGGGVPTWEIRARRIVHDNAARQIYFTGAQFRVMGVPVLYLPRLRLPDPSNRRAAGLLVPRVRSTSTLGAGLKLPYFVPLGAHADLTLTPYLARETRTLEARYRQAFASGDLAFEGALSDDTLGGRTADDRTEDGTRFYLFGTGDVALPRDFRLRFGVQAVSDPAYLLDYGTSDRDRLTSALAVSRYRRREAFLAGITDFRTLRDAEIPIRAQLPRNYGVLRYDRRIAAPWGEVRLGADGTTLGRSSDDDGVGRDTSRLGVSALYTGRRVLRGGLLGRIEAGLSADAYTVDQDSRFDAAPLRTVPQALAELRWPLQRSTPSGVHHLLEPRVVLAWSDVGGDPVPNEDSVLVELDESNLGSLSRYPGEDAADEGWRAALGLGWTRTDPDGWTMGIELGRVLREDAARGTSVGPGDGGGWLVSAGVDLGTRLDLSARGLFDDGLEATQAEARLAYADERRTLASTYLYLTPDPDQNRPATLHEVSVDGALRLSRHWTGSLDGRFDLENDRAARAGVGLEYRTECLRAAVSVSRRFTASDSVAPTTDFGFDVSLAGFGGRARDETYRRRCRQ